MKLPAFTDAGRTQKTTATASVSARVWTGSIADDCPHVPPCATHHRCWNRLNIEQGVRDGRVTAEQAAALLAKPTHAS
jgi:hypothetical protein